MLSIPPFCVPVIVMFSTVIYSHFLLENRPSVPSLAKLLSGVVNQVEKLNVHRPETLLIVLFAIEW